MGMRKTDTGIRKGKLGPSQQTIERSIVVMACGVRRVVDGVSVKAH